MSTDDALWYALSPRAAIACTLGAVAFIGWRTHRWWKHALDFQIAVAGDD